MPYPRHTAGLTSHFNTLIFSQEHAHLHWTLTGVKMNGRQTLLCLFNSNRFYIRIPGFSGLSAEKVLQGIRLRTDRGVSALPAEQ